VFVVREEACQSQETDLLTTNAFQKGAAAALHPGRDASQMLRRKRWSCDASGIVVFFACHLVVSLALVAKPPAIGCYPFEKNLIFNTKWTHWYET
jgi:hypothetical protein